MSAVTPSRDVGERRAALELHRLGRGDRAWVLSRLAPDERARAARRLAELDALGVRFELDDDRIGVAARAEDSAGPVVAAPFADSARARVRAAEAHTVARVLDGEPGWLVDALLDVEPWPWRDGVRAALGTRVVASPPRESIRAQGPSRPATAAALVELVAARLPDVPAVAPSGADDRHSNPSPGWSRLLTGMKQWLR